MSQEKMQISGMELSFLGHTAITMYDFVQRSLKHNSEAVHSPVIVPETTR